MKFKAIIPCAGLGSRMKLKKNQSKEMLSDPNTGKPLIQYHLDICKKLNIEPLVIVRKEKKDLIKYLIQQKVSYVVIKLKGEWYDTVLAVSHLWGEYNILLLPDTRFNSVKVVENIQKSLLLGNQLVLGLHIVDDPSSWGIVRHEMVEEKPKNIGLGQYHAWGVIGFHELEGYNFFKDMLETKLYYLPASVGYHFFTWFKDLTRTGKLEKY